MRTDEEETPTLQVNPGYALGQIAKALVTTEEHEDQSTRERAREKIEKWVTVFNGIVGGSLKVGSRTPVPDVPAWATLEVLTGGFATGEMLAGGPLKNHESDLLNRLALEEGPESRRLLNAYYLTEMGMAELLELLDTGRYDVSLPEEGALLVVAWLVNEGYATEARELIDELAPFFSKLRFYPVPKDHTQHGGSRVFLQDVAKTIRSLDEIKPNRNIFAQKEAIEIWAPLYAEAVALFIETVNGAPPSLYYLPDRKQEPGKKRKYRIKDGWPCQKYSVDWHSRAKRLLITYERLRTEHKICGKPERAKENFFQLREYLARCVDLHESSKKRKDGTIGKALGRLGAPKPLSGRDVGRIRMILAQYIAKRGIPQSKTWRASVDRQIRQVKAPAFYEVAAVVKQRLAQYPLDGGVEEIEPLLQPVSDEEGGRAKLPSGTPIPSSIERKVSRCLIDSIDALVARNIITSGESLARVLPQMTSEIRAAGITDSNLRYLYSSIYRAFRRRRSLLLLNLESQVRIEELPWVSAIESFRSDALSDRELAKQTLEEVVIVTLTSFPHVIIPNKLLQELKTLVDGAKLDIPLTEEVAADIFMGQFSDKYRESGRRAGDLLSGTLYARYYDIDYEAVRNLPILKRSRFLWVRRRKIEDPLVQLCGSRTGVLKESWWEGGRFDVAVNGMIIEQQQIITSHNLAVLFMELGLVVKLQDRLFDLARHCFTWICRRLQMKPVKTHAKLIALKNAAYAWRQMVFYIALMPLEESKRFIEWACEHLGSQETGFRNRFLPALRGLENAVNGLPYDERGANGVRGRLFLGWTNKRHWLIDKPIGKGESTGATNE